MLDNYRKGDTESLPEENNYTTDYIYALPDGERVELIDGKLYPMQMPLTIHQALVGGIACKILNYLDANNKADDVYMSPFAVFLKNDNRTYVEPDISVICDMAKLDDRGCNGAPDWIIEVTSKESQTMDYLIKLFEYRAAGVREYWVVNPMNQTVTVYTFKPEEDYGQYTFDDDVPVGIYEGFSIKVSELL